MTATREGEYKDKGDYHKTPDKKWRYYPVYVKKMEYIDSFFKSVPKDAKILDVGCGEGIVVERYRKKGYDVRGIDLAYSSDCVTQGDITGMPYKDGEFDMLLCLDVIEHLNFDKQELAVKEMNRVLKNGGTLVLSVPNVAHLASRIAFLFTGKLLRTSSIDRHPGDRPYNEYAKMVKDAGFAISKTKGLFPTFPIATVLTYFFPGKVLWLHGLLNSTVAYPPICFLNLFICKKE